MSLFHWGNIKLADEHDKNISIVGARKANKYGKFLTTSLVKELAKYNCNIVSGLAIGIDSFAHKAALDNNLNTIAVLGCGLKAPGVGNQPLKEKIQLDPSNLILSEYPDEYPAMQHTFLERNRIIASLSQLTIIVQAGIQSGSLNTARHARELGKQVFSFPGELGDINFEGNNYLLSNNLAKPIFSIEDFVENLGLKALPELPNEACDDSQDPILRQIPKRGISIDDLMQKLEMDYSELSVKLTMLEIENRIKVSTNAVSLT